MNGDVLSHGPGGPSYVARIYVNVGRDSEAPRLVVIAVNYQYPCGLQPVTLLRRKAIALK